MAEAAPTLTTAGAGAGGAGPGTGTESVTRAGGAAASLPTVAPLFKYKMCFLGDQSVGKSSIIRVFVKGTFPADYKATIGVDFLSKTMYLEDRTIRLQIWDTAGQERFRALAPSYIRDSQAAVVVYDVTSRASFLNVPQWVADVRAVQGSDAMLALVGNKDDLGSDRQVSLEEAKAKAQELGVAVFMEASAKEGHNIKALFRRLATALPADGAAPVVPDSGMIDFKLSPRPPKAADSSSCSC